MSIELDKIFGRIQLVDTFADYRVEVVDAFADLRVKKVDASADGAGLWHVVDAFPDFRIQIGLALRKHRLHIFHLAKASIPASDGHLR